MSARLKIPAKIRSSLIIGPGQLINTCILSAINVDGRMLVYQELLEQKAVWKHG